MSQIDEAFIQAYAEPQQPTAVPGAGQVPVAPPQPPLVGLHRGPHIRLNATTQNATTQNATTQNATTLNAATTPPADPQPVAIHPVAPQPPVTSPSPAATPSGAWSPEPLPAPHFQVPASPQVTTNPQVASAPPSNFTSAPVPVAPYSTAEADSPLGSTTQRRPLSTFSAPEPAPTIAFNPVFEVDAFRWPAITNELLAAHHELLIPVAEQLLDVCEQGRSLVGIAGTRPNVGCSTLLLCLARLIGSVGKSVALVDANFSKASLGRDLGLEFDTGWEHVLTGQMPLAESVVNSLQDNMALLPLARPTSHANELLASIQTSVTAGVLRYHYDVVLFNLGAAGQTPLVVASLGIMEHCRLDASIIIADTERTGIDPMDTLLSLLGNTCLGVIGNSAA